MHTADAYEDSIFVFRGGDGRYYLNDLHALDTSVVQPVTTTRAVQARLSNLTYGCEPYLPSKMHTKERNHRGLVCPVHMVSVYRLLYGRQKKTLQ